MTYSLIITLPYFIFCLRRINTVFGIGDGPKPFDEFMHAYPFNTTGLKHMFNLVIITSGILDDGIQRFKEIQKQMIFKVHHEVAGKYVVEFIKPFDKTLQTVSV